VASRATIMTTSAMPSTPSTSSPCSSPPPDPAPKPSLTRPQILAEITRLYQALRDIPRRHQPNGVRGIGAGSPAYVAIVAEIRALAEVYKATADDDDRLTRSQEFGDMEPVTTRRRCG
jgi:hypothetical protein